MRRRFARKVVLSWKTGIFPESVGMCAINDGKENTMDVCSLLKGKGKVGEHRISPDRKHHTVFWTNQLVSIRQRLVVPCFAYGRPVGSLKECGIKIEDGGFSR